ncbi:LytR/AlgR family response regulator transcription factor [Larkinella soli]|uniref:LytR/AlgR family response regulator transcription factor n=1 Tax=Larkinella soli TaxID=1770527 RepID=UPI000FFC34D6|nr:LytTR family DNA-binding domain-containing protein [Larkinella soli]
MTTFRTLLIDDEELSREVLKSFLYERPEITVVCECADGYSAVEQITTLRPDFIFLDVQMPEMDGFEVVRQVQPVYLPYIIFATAYDQYALKAFELKALDYLLKPFDRRRFGQAVARAVEQLTLRRASDFHTRIESLLTHEETERPTRKPEYLPRLMIRDHRRIFFVPVEEVDYLEADGNYLWVHTEGRRHLMNESISRLEQSLSPERFIRINRSYIINQYAIQEMEPYFNGEYNVKLKTGAVLRWSRSYRDRLTQLAGWTP